MTLLKPLCLATLCALAAACDDPALLEGTDPDALAFGCPASTPSCGSGLTLRVDHRGTDADMCTSGDDGVFSIAIPQAPTCGGAYPVLVVQPGEDECIPAWCNVQDS